MPRLQLYISRLQGSMVQREFSDYDFRLSGLLQLGIIRAGRVAIRLHESFQHGSATIALIRTLRV